MIRSNNDIIKMLRKVLIDIDELKTSQPVGTNQIVVKPYDTGAAYDAQYTITAPFQSVGSSFKLLKITVTPDALTDNNILLSEVIPELKYTNGVRISNWGGPSSTGYGISPITDPNDLGKNTYLLFIVAPTGTIMRLKTYIVANAKVTFTVQDLI